MMVDKQPGNVVVLDPASWLTENARAGDLA
jgi:hypothetical protein